MKLKKKGKCESQVPKRRSWVMVYDGEENIFVKVAYPTNEKKGSGFMARARKSDQLKPYSQFIGILDGKDEIARLQKKYFKKKHKQISTGENLDGYTQGG